MERRGGGQKLVPGGLRLRAGGAEQLLGLLLGRQHAIVGRAVGLGDPLAGACLGLLAQLRGGAFGCSDDARDAARRGAESVRVGFLSAVRLLVLKLLHAAIVKRGDGPRTDPRGRARTRRARGAVADLRTWQE